MQEEERHPSPPPVTYPPFPSLRLVVAVGEAAGRAVEVGVPSAPLSMVTLTCSVLFLREDRTSQLLSRP